MIIATGIDIVAIKRMQSVFHKHPKRCLKKILGEQERSEFEKRMAINPSRGIRYLATRFAAKEAFYKAASGHLNNLYWQALQILNDADSKPMPVFANDLQQQITQKKLQVHISISDEKEYAVASVVLETFLREDSC